MPIYEYQCKNCNHEFEQLVFDRAAPVHCPECGSKRAKKLPSVFARHGGDSDSPAVAAGGSSCGSCSASSCAGCSH